MKERPVLFSAPMVRAILDGRKTQTRRVMKPQPEMVIDKAVVPWDGSAETLLGLLEQAGRRCPYGKPGDMLWVKESHRFDSQVDAIRASELSAGEPICYEADGVVRTTGCHMIQTGRLRPSIFMPRWASRITLEITGVRVERLQDISEQDALEEGISYLQLPSNGLDPAKARTWFRGLWDSINGPGSWVANPWVWVVEFRRIAP